MKGLYQYLTTQWTKNESCVEQKETQDEWIRTKELQLTDFQQGCQDNSTGKEQSF